jgi:hypothetical protein
MKGGAETVEVAGDTSGGFVPAVWLANGFVAIAACTVSAAAVIISDCEGAFPGRLQERIIPAVIKIAGRLLFIYFLQDGYYK